MHSEMNMTITEILDLSQREDFEVYKGAVILGDPTSGRFEVQHDYGHSNVTYWPTHEEAREEAARLFLTGEASYIDDFIVKASD